MSRETLDDHLEAIRKFDETIAQYEANPRGAQFGNIEQVRKWREERLGKVEKLREKERKREVLKARREKIGARRKELNLQREELLGKVDKIGAELGALKRRYDRVRQEMNEELDEVKWRYSGVCEELRRLRAESEVDDS